MILPFGTLFVGCVDGLLNLIQYFSIIVLDEDLTPEDVIIQMRELRGPRAVQSVKQYNFINEFRELCHKAESLEYEDEGCVSR